MLGIAFLTGTQLLSGVLNDSIDSLVSSVYEKIDVVVRSPQAQETGFGPPIRGTHLCVGRSRGRKRSTASPSPKG